MARKLTPVLAAAVAGALVARVTDLAGLSDLATAVDAQARQLEALEQRIAVTRGAETSEGTEGGGSRMIATMDGEADRAAHEQVGVVDERDEFRVAAAEVEAALASVRKGLEEMRELDTRADVEELKQLLGR
jgi:hypothetical protein